MTKGNARVYVNTLSDRDLMELIPKTESEQFPSPLAEIHTVAKEELSGRLIEARQRLYNARFEVQQAENKVRALMGLPEIALGGVDGDIHD